MKIPEGSNNFHSVNFPMRRFFSLEVISEDKDENGDGIADYDAFGSPKGTPIEKTADRTSFCGYLSVDPKVVTPCKGPLVFPGIGTGFSSDFTFMRPPSTGMSTCGKDFRSGAPVNTGNPAFTCSVVGFITETQMERNFPDQHMEWAAYFHVNNPDCVRSLTDPCASGTPGSGNLSALTNSHDPASTRGVNDPLPPAITIQWAQHITDPDLAGALDLNQPAAFTQTMTGKFDICNPDVWQGCNQLFPAVNAPTGESQTKGDANFLVGVDKN